MNPLDCETHCCGAALGKGGSESWKSAPKAFYDSKYGSLGWEPGAWKLQGCLRRIYEREALNGEKQYKLLELNAYIT